MSAPKWGIFMKKVYADRNLGYGKIKDFEKPAKINTGTIDADAPGFKGLFSGDSTTTNDY